jgi:hypothetical protein
MRTFRSPFIPNQFYSWHQDVRVSGIPQAILDQSIRRDGRFLGLLAEHILVGRFDNLEVSGRSGSSYDLVEYPVGGGLRSWEQKVAAQGKSISLVASCMKGAGRSFDEVKHRARRSGLYGYILIDLSAFPLMRMRGVMIAELDRRGWSKEIKRADLDNLLMPHGDLVTMASG